MVPQGCRAGYAFAWLKLRSMYGIGEGVPRDLVSAYNWSNLSVAQGNKTTKGSKFVYAKWMTRDQIAEAQRLSRECFARKHKGCRQIKKSTDNFLGFLNSFVGYPSLLVDIRCHKSLLRLFPFRLRGIDTLHEFAGVQVYGRGS